MPDGGFLLTGVAAQDGGNVTGNHGSGDVWTMRTDSTGFLLWQNSHGGSGGDGGDDILFDSLKQIIVVGTTYSNNGDVNGNHGGADAWLLQIDTDGTLINQKCFGGSDNDFALSIQPISDGGFIICGITYSSDNGLSEQHGRGDGWLLKLDSSFNVVWQHCYGGRQYDALKKVIYTSDGNYLCTGFTYSTDGDVSDHRGDTTKGDAWIIKVDTSGTLLWQKSFGGSLQDFADVTIETHDHNYLFAGTTSSSDSDVTGNHSSGWYSDAWLVKFDSASIIWQKCLGGNSSENGVSLYESAGGDITFFGCAASVNNGDVTGGYGSNDYWLVHLDSNRVIQWNKCFGGSQTDQAFEFLPLRDNVFLLAGWSNSMNGDVTVPIGMEDYWLLKVESNTITTAGDFADPDSRFFIYPNPATHNFTIDWNGSADVAVVTISDMTGRKCWSGTVMPDSKIDLEAMKISEGIYFVKIQAGDVLRTGKIVVTR